MISFDRLDQMKREVEGQATILKDVAWTVERAPHATYVWSDKILAAVRVLLDQQAELLAALAKDTPDG